MITMRWTAALCAGLLYAASSVHAQPLVDPRYQPWIGCWRAIGGVDGTIDGAWKTQPTRACVTPSKSVPGSVDVAMFVGDSLVSRTALPRAGVPRERDIDECRGTETAEWTKDETRLILRAEMQCARGIRRTETGLMSITPAGEWLQMQHMEVAGKSATTAARFRFEGDSARPIGVTLGDDRSSRTLRLAVGGPVSLAELVELSRRVPASLMEAWVTELEQRFTLDGKTLVKLADQGLPPRVIDLLVAMSHPEAFSLRADAEFERGEPDEAWVTNMPNDRPRRMDRCSVYDDFCYGPGGMGAWGLGWRFGYGPWDPWDPWGARFGFPYSRFGGYFGDPYGYGGGMYWGRQPIVIVNRPVGSDEPEERGRAVNGGGYTRTGSSRPSTNTSPSARSGGSSSGSSGSAAGSGSSGSSGSGSTGRTAKPRPPGGR